MTYAEELAGLLEAERRLEFLRRVEWIAIWLVRNESERTGALTMLRDILEGAKLETINTAFRPQNTDDRVWVYTGIYQYTSIPRASYGLLPENMRGS